MKKTAHWAVFSYLMTSNGQKNCPTFCSDSACDPICGYAYSVVTVGHADVDMTQHYLHVQDGIRQEAIRRFAEAFPIDGHSPEDPEGGACRIIPFPQVV